MSGPDGDPSDALFKARPIWATEYQTLQGTLRSNVKCMDALAYPRIPCTKIWPFKIRYYFIRTLLWTRKICRSVTQQLSIWTSLNGTKIRPIFQSAKGLAQNTRRNSAHLDNSDLRLTVSIISRYLSFSMDETPMTFPSFCPKRSYFLRYAAFFKLKS